MSAFVVSEFGTICKDQPDVCLARCLHTTKINLLIETLAIAAIVFGALVSTLTRTGARGTMKKCM